MQNLLNLVEVIKSQLLKVHDIFFSPEPKLVTIKRFAEDNSVEDVNVPNLAKINADLLETVGVIELEGTALTWEDLVNLSQHDDYNKDNIELNGHTAYQKVAPVEGHEEAFNLLPGEVAFVTVKVFGLDVSKTELPYCHEADIIMYNDGSGGVLHLKGGNSNGSLLKHDASSVDDVVGPEMGMYGFAAILFDETPHLRLALLLNVWPVEKTDTAPVPKLWGTAKIKKFVV
ncbi:MAG: hypothetical protein ACOX2F_07135 [bacterium]